MKIVEQVCRMKASASLLKAEYPTENLFQIFVNGRLQDKSTCVIEGENINFGFDCLVAGDVVQIFYCLS
ncbi:precorrin-4 methylase [Sporomusaceae bacterium BoRhaA]|jgi:hypothetical protein|uniref:hypothetical protein n=1 Tax=Pelorhabdus rhamnosifermentans TaxID=2772457 RepID=UPI001C060439|nr:hypothetical protein [Pelorhabdus rhamnosifermentans]MBU2698924.1 precorrin-4 methylase [Pelorhabdus rhamnosifermentans]